MLRGGGGEMTQSNARDRGDAWVRKHTAAALQQCSDCRFTVNTTRVRWALGVAKRSGFDQWRSVSTFLRDHLPLGGGRCPVLLECSGARYSRHHACLPAIWTTAGQ